MDDLFSVANKQANLDKTPLAARMRPQTLADFAGQEDIIGQGCLLRRAIEADRISSVIFYGPPGSGKTTLAQIIANSTQSDFQRLSAVTAGIANVREVIDKAQENQRFYSRRTVLFIDEIHRFNKSQQDALLPAVEDGTIILIGATSENPYCEVNKALLSRSRVFALKPLSKENIKALLQRAITDKTNGYGNLPLVVDDEALDYLASRTGGDARNAYNGLELAVLTTEPSLDGVRYITKDIVAESIQEQVVAYDKSGDWHYDVASAFIKSMRGSDPDAAVHYLARMIEAGEDPQFIARRVVICAAEDVGLADPQALVLAQAAADAVHFVGFPEARIILAEAVIYVATAPKSNTAYLAIDTALADLKNHPFTGVPYHLRDNHYAGASDLGYGKGYKYVHDYPNAYVDQQYLPEEIKNTKYYYPKKYGFEQKIFERLKNLKKD
ncbi:MAG: replication-associated recombination protein A [Clostridia bacterium]|nr:replication-associated recombination protein A [Clostridia bacterium]